MATSPLTCLSTNLKSIEPYLDIATDFENLYPSVSYLCRFYALQKGFTLYKAEDDLPVLLELISLLSHTSAAFSDQTMNQIEDLALKFIEWGDTAPSLEKYNEITFKSFYSAKLLLDVCLLFGELKATTAEKKKCLTLKVMNMQESRASLVIEKQASLQKQEKPSSETEDSNAHFAGGSLVKRQAVDDLSPQLPIKELPKNVQPRTAHILYLQSKELHTSPTDLLQEMPAFVTAADNASKAITSPSEIKEIHVTPSVQAAITPSNPTTRFDKVQFEEKALQSVDVPQTPQTPDSTHVGIPTLGVKQKVNMANPVHYYPMQGEPTERNNQFFNRFIHPGNQRMTRPPISVRFPCYPPNDHQVFNYPKFNPRGAIVPQFGCATFRPLHFSPVPFSPVPFSPVPFSPVPFRPYERHSSLSFDNQSRYLLHPVTPKYYPRYENTTFYPRCFKQKTMVFPPGDQFAYYQPQQQSQDHTTQQPSHVAGTSSLLVRETAPAPPELHPAAETANSSTSTVKVGDRVVSNAVSVSFPVATTMPAEPIPASKLAATHKTLLKVTSPDGKLLLTTPTIKSVAATPVTAHATKPVATISVIASDAKPIASTPVTAPAAATLLARPVVATPIAKQVAATPVAVAKSVSETPVSKPIAATPITATPVAETLSDTLVKIPAPKSVAATLTSANPVSGTAIPFAKPVVVTPVAAQPVTTPMSTTIAAIPVPAQVPTPFAVTPVATSSHVSLENCEQTGRKQGSPTRESDPTQTPQHQLSKSDGRRRLKCLVS